MRPSQPRLPDCFAHIMSLLQELESLLERVGRREKVKKQRESLSQFSWPRQEALSV